MSWNGYTDKIVKSGLTGAVIYGLGGGKWASSGSVSITDQEVAVIVKGWSDANGLRASNAKVGGKKYIVLQVLDNAIYAKAGTDGLCATKTGKCVIIGFYDKNLQAGKANMAVESMGDYLRDAGY
eukprot:TRINITY_DN57733_c0_g1_i1.p1 TRINITY_DN57733_c0_g1~~TRINITY_DN57733_c0_g1_i1.p1  ORF type:complete len:125 (+),score=11.91 TRINITY_DN57733_c0_g1_i1:13-387(+)